MPSAVVKTCASTILAPVAAQAPATIDKSLAWSGAMIVSSVTPRSRSARIWVIGAGISTSVIFRSLACRSFCSRCGLEPIGLRKPRRIGLEIEVGPLRQRTAQFLAGLRDTLLAVDRRMAAGEHNLGLPIERAQKFALPIVPDARSDGADVADGKNKKHFEAFERLHAVGEGRDGCVVAEIAPLRGIRHDQMVLDQPGHGLGLGFREAETRTKRARDVDPGAANDLPPAPWRCRAGKARETAPSGWRSTARSHSPAEVPRSAFALRARRDFRPRARDAHRRCNDDTC